MLAIKYTHGSDIDIAGDEHELQALCAALNLCASNGFDVEFKTDTNVDAAPYDKLLTNIVITISFSKNRFSVSEDTLLIEGDEDFLLNLSSNIPWDYEDTYSGLSYHVHYDRDGFGEFLDDDSLDVILTKKRNT